MDNRVSYVLNNMITAVDEGFSYDGIVSVPDTGLEDVAYRSGLASSLCDSVGHVRITSAAISQEAARAFKQTQHHHSRNYPMPMNGIREKSELSLALSDQQREDLSEVQDERPDTSDVIRAEMDEQSLVPRKEIGIEPYTAKRIVDDGTDVVCGCFPGSLFPSIRVKDVRARPLEQKNLRKNIEEGWDIVTPIAPSQEGLPGKNSEVGWEANRFFNTIHGGLTETKDDSERGQFSNVNRERLPRKRDEILSTINLETLPRKVGEKEGVIPLSTVELERLPRKKEERLPRKRQSGEEGHLD